MNQFRIVHSAVTAIVVGLCWLALSNFRQIAALAETSMPSVMSTVISNDRYAAIVMMGMLIFLARWNDKLSTALVEKIPGFSPALRRTLSGKEFVEGDWPLVVIDMARQQLMYFGFLTISYKGGQPYVSGEDWSPAGEPAQKFHSVQARYERHVMQYWYEQGASLHEPSMEGYTKIYFFPEGRPAERHAGKFLDPNHTTDIRFYAVRQRYGWFERPITTKEKKIEAARALWASIYKDLGSLKGRDISADFV